MREELKLEIEKAKFKFKFSETIPTKAASPEKINHPAHYGGDTPYEAIKVIQAWELGFELGNVLKYIKRSGRDGLPIFSNRQRYPERLEDLKKARKYLDFKITEMEKLAAPAASPISDALGPMPPEGWTAEAFPTYGTIKHG